MDAAISPADPLLVLSDENILTLFDANSAISPTTAALTPPPSVDSEDPRSDSTASQAEKKPTKKRKSWGQELPTPKTNLPPRKRAKTEDEKEQRRIERVLRNRAAAQSSRERKRKEVEGLEEEKELIRRQNALLTSRLRQVEIENQELSNTITKMAAEMAVFRRLLNGDAQSGGEQPKQISPTLSADLMPLNETVPHLKQELSDLDFSLPPPQSTVDPRKASFSSASESAMDESTATTSDLTQHPAEMLCDLQCQSEVSRLRWMIQSSDPSTSSQSQVSLVIFLTMWHLLLATMASAVSSHLAQPLAQIFHSLKTGCPISMAATASAETLFPLIRWLISTPINPLSTLAATTTTLSRSSPAQPIFRINLLRRLLACSPALARPLREATGRALRLTSSSGRAGGGLFGDDGSGGGGNVGSLMTMMWAIELFERSRKAEDPPSEMRRLCATLDEFMGDDAPGSMGRTGKVVGRGNG